MAFTDHPQPKINIISIGSHRFIGEDHRHQLAPSESQQIEAVVAQSDILCLESLAKENLFRHHGPNSAAQIAEESALAHNKQIINLQGELNKRYYGYADMWQQAGIDNNPARSQTTMVLEVVDSVWRAMADRIITHPDQIPNYISTTTVFVSGAVQRASDGKISQPDRMLIETLNKFSLSIIARGLEDETYFEQLSQTEEEYTNLNAQVRDIAYTTITSDICRRHPDKKLLFVMGMGQKGHQKAVENGINGLVPDPAKLVQDGQAFLDRALRFIQQA